MNPDKIKIALFDLNAKHQELMFQLEEEIEKEDNQEEEENLKDLWSNYHTAMMETIRSGKELISAIKSLEDCAYSCNQIFEKKRTEKVESPLNLSDMVEANLPSNLGETPNINSEEESKREESQEATDNTIEVIIDGKPVHIPVEIPNNLIQNQRIENMKEETPSIEESSEKEDNLETPKESILEKEEEQDMVKELIPTNIEMPQEEGILSPSDSTEKKDETQKLDDTIMSEILPENIEVPKQETPLEIESGTTSPIVQLPKIEENQINEISLKEEELKNTNNKIFKKSDLLDTKAILITQNQANKLRASKETQKALFNQKENNYIEEENVTESQMEEMMSQLSSLYEQGKTEEAEKISEKISVLSKKLPSNIA